MNWEARFPWTNGSSGWPSAIPGCYWLCFGRPGHKINCPCEAKILYLFVLILSWEARFPWTNGTSCWPSPVMGDFGCVLGGQATKYTICVRPKDIFCVNFGQEGHLPIQHPGFGSKHSSKGKPGCTFENLAVSCRFLPARKAFRTTAQVLYSAYIFLYILMVCLHR